MADEWGVQRKTLFPYENIMSQAIHSLQPAPIFSVDALA
jgi:hypothetical protein